MHWWMIVLLAVGLGADAMSVSIGVGVRWNGPGQKFRLAWHMGLFQAVMPVIGWFVGKELAGWIANVGGYIAAGLVVLIGGKMLFEALENEPGYVAEHAAHVEQARDPTRGWTLLVLSVATSIDALVVGLSAGLRGGRIWLMAAVIGVVAAGMSLLGVNIAQRLGRRFGRNAEIAGAVLLIGLGVSFFWL